jgi:hypothetical protein
MLVMLEGILFKKYGKYIFQTKVINHLCNYGRSHGNVRICVLHIPSVLWVVCDTS